MEMDPPHVSNGYVFVEKKPHLTADSIVTTVSIITIYVITVKFA